MVRSAMCIGFVIGMGTGAISPNSTSSEPAKITLTLPSNIPSEAVQINYFMVGAFGGVGDFVRPVRGKSAYDIPASVDGMLVENVKIIAYIPGCEIVTLEIPIGQATLPHPLICKILQKTLLRGVISQASTIREYEHAEVEISYLAKWDHRFFGFADGPVTAIQVASAVPDARGQFEASVPDFGSQPSLGEAAFQIILRDPTNGNTIAFLTPTAQGADSYDLRVRTNYPSVIKFRAKKP